MRKSCDSTKSGLFALGRLENISTYMNDLQKLTDETVDAATLDTRVTQAYAEERELNFFYSDQGDIKTSAFDDRRTCRYAVETGYLSKSTNPAYPPDKIYAYYTRDLYGNWAGVGFGTRYRMENSFNAYRIGNISFRNYSEANNFICNLAAALLPGEVWKFKSSSADDYRPKTTYDILQNYLQFVFDKLLNEYQNPESKNFNKIVFSEDKKYALFNTGLLSEFAQDVYLVGEVFNRQPNGYFTLSTPVIAPGKVDLMRNFYFSKKVLSPYPDVVEFFNHLNEIIYDAEVEIDLSPEKLNHIIKDGAKRKRFPEKYTNLYENGDFATIATTLKTAIENAQKIAKRNYKYVVPQYRSAKHGETSKIQFLMPIYLDSQYGRKPDFALVLNEEKIGPERFYTPETILELSWAYNNARVICKPEDTWLNPASIEGSTDLSGYTDEA